MGAVLLSGDLMVLSRVEAAAARAGTAIRSAGSAAQAMDACDSEPTKLLIVDLTAPQLDINSLVRDVKSSAGSTTQVIAFGPHVHEERLQAASEAGCDEVISRGQFFAQMDSILARYVAK